MRRKKTSSKWNIVLPVGRNKSYGFDKKKERWFTVIIVNGAIEKTYNDATTEAEAIAIRDSRFASLEMNSGAVRMTKKLTQAESNSKLPRADKIKPTPMQYITAIEKMVKTTYYKVTVNGVYVGKSKDVVKARKIRNDYLSRTGGCKPCATCGRLPEINYDGKSDNKVMRHADCPNEYQSVRAPKYSLIARWNARLWRRHRDGLEIVPEDGAVPPRLAEHRKKWAAEKKAKKEEPAPVTPDVPYPGYDPELGF
jgi:hypothetical protein